MNEELSTAHKSIGISCEIIYGSMWYIEEGMSSAPRAEIQPCSDITLVLSHFPQASDTMVDPRMGELARSCCSNTSPILPHPCLQGVWYFLPETSYLVYSKYFLSFLCADISLSLHVFLQEQRSLPCTSSMDVTLSGSSVFYQLVVFSWGKLLGWEDVGILAMTVFQTVRQSFFWELFKYFRRLRNYMQGSEEPNCNTTGFKCFNKILPCQLFWS